MNRRKFLKNTALTTVALSSANTLLACAEAQPNKTLTVNSNKTTSIAICTWGFSAANAKAGDALSKKTKALDAAIKCVSVEEENIKNTTVGIGATRYFSW